MVCSTYSYTFFNSIKYVHLQIEGFNQLTCTHNTIITEYADDEAIISFNAGPLIASRNLQTRLYLIFLWINGALIEDSKLIKIDPILLHSL